MLLKEKLSGLLSHWREEVKVLIQQRGDAVISSVTIGQLYGGARGIGCLICDTSSVAPDTGLVVRGRPITNLAELLPEQVFFLLLTGDLPNPQELTDLQDELKKRNHVPAYIWKVIDAMPDNSHPMCLFNTAILAMQHESVFSRKYEEGMPKAKYWEATLEDALNIIAKLPGIAAGIYRWRYKRGDLRTSDPKLDWSADYVQMMGIPDPAGEVAKLMRLYWTLHCDHESGNVSAGAAMSVNSALSDLYYALSAGLNGLAGPLHGLANQECLKWVLMLRDKFHGVPSTEELKKFAWDTLNSGKVVPGYGHAVLRVTDPRFTACLEFGKKYCNQDPIFQIVSKVYETVPDVLKEVQKIKDPWPNVDAASGALLYHYGLTEFDYYTVLFSVSRALGICAQAVINRGMGYPIFRPKSLTTASIQKMVNAQAKQAAQVAA